MNRIPRLILFALLCLLSATKSAQAEELMMVRSSEPFPETMSLLQETIRNHGYTLSRVQRVDIGLTKSGYKTDKYRVVFFGKDEEIQRMIQIRPELVSYLPLKIVVYAEESDTILVSLDPAQLKSMYPDANMAATFDRWSRDVHDMLHVIRQQSNQALR